MAGTLIPAVAKTKFDFSSLLAGANSSYFIATGVEVSQYRYGELMPRIHALSIVGAGATPSITLDVFPEAPSPEDPGMEFYNASIPLVNPALTFSLSPSSVAPILPASNVNIIPPMGGFVRIRLKGTQGATQATTFWIVLSVDIAAKA
jgi:hypothetical protein